METGALHSGRCHQDIAVLRRRAVAAAVQSDMNAGTVPRAVAPYKLKSFEGHLHLVENDVLR